MRRQELAFRKFILDITIFSVASVLWRARFYILTLSIFGLVVMFALSRGLPSRSVVAEVSEGHCIMPSIFFEPSAIDFRYEDENKFMLMNGSYGSFKYLLEKVIEEIADPDTIKEYELILGNQNDTRIYESSWWKELGFIFHIPFRKRIQINEEYNNLGRSFSISIPNGSPVKSEEWLGAFVNFAHQRARSILIAQTKDRLYSELVASKILLTEIDKILNAEGFIDHQHYVGRSAEAYSMYEPHFSISANPMQFSLIELKTKLMLGFKSGSHSLDEIFTFYSNQRKFITVNISLLEYYLEILETDECDFIRIDNLRMVDSYHEDLLSMLEQKIGFFFH